jgi:hypothetical protein
MVYIKVMWFPQLLLQKPRVANFMVLLLVSMREIQKLIVAFMVHTTIFPTKFLLAN